MCDVCDGKSLDELRSKTLHDIMEHGHQVIGIPDGDPPFAYSLGRCLVEQPEFVVTGNLNVRLMQHMINAAAEIAKTETIENGYEFEPDTLLDGFPVRVVEVDPLSSQMFQALYLAQDSGDIALRALQLVWPDTDGNFPGEGFDTRFEQPIYALEKS